MNRIKYTWDRNGKEYPTRKTNRKKNLVELIIPVNDVLDYYTNLDPKRLDQAIKAANNVELIHIMEAVKNETEVEIDGNMILWVYNGQGEKKPYNPADTTDASLVATVLQGKDDKFEAALEECAKRGIRFTIKQQTAAAKRGRTLSA